MQPPSSRTGAWRTHHHRVAITRGLSGLDIAKALQYCSLSLYVRVLVASSDFGSQRFLSVDSWAFEILFEFRKAADADAHNTIREKLMGRLEGKSVVITGAGSGIGRAASVLFSREGAKLVIVDRTEGVKETAKLVSDAGGTVEAVMADAGSETDVKAFIDKAVAKYGRLDAIWANAGVSGGLVPIPEQTVEHWQEVLRINLIGPFLAIKHSMPHMIRQKSGSIVCTASVAGLKAGASGHPYGASKAGVISLVQTTAYSLSGTGVRINAVCPGLIETGMTKPVFDRAKERGTQDKIGQLNPLKRPGQPHELAAMGLFLASDDASYVNGQAIPVDGGLTASMPYTGKPI
jgi:NAD(P)-dependent dehydrogenase (short-subunit alcohol dehydrogenase family)